MSAGVFWVYAAAVVMAGLICLLAVLLVLNVRVTARVPRAVMAVRDWLLAAFRTQPCPTCGCLGAWMGETPTSHWFFCDRCDQPWLEAKRPETPARSSKAVA